MYWRIGRVEPSGPEPPEKAMNIWSKIFKEAMTWRVTTSTVVPRSWGRVTDHSLRQKPAPSTSAAS